MIDRFLVDLNLIQADDESLGEEAGIAMITGAELFLRGGGVVSWEFWSSLGSVSRNAFVVARTRIRKEEIAMSALAADSPSYAMELMSQVDGGEMKMYYSLSAVLDHAEGKLRRKRPVDMKVESAP